MRKNANILQFVFGTVVCCFIVQFVQVLVFHTYTSSEADKQTSKESHLTVHSSHISGYALASESSVSTQGDTFSYSTKSQSKVFFSTTKINEQVFHALYVQYTFYARNLLICFRPTDIIFPFHYFW